MTTVTNEKTTYYNEHSNMDYPVGVYYVDTSKMFMHGVRLHWHNEIEIDYVRSGEALFCIGDEHIIVPEGSAIIINSGHIHSVKNNNSTDTVILSVLFDSHYLFDNDSSFLSLKYSKPVLDNENFRYLIFSDKTRSERSGIEIINEILRTNLDKAYGYELMTKSLLCSLWLHIIERTKNADNSIRFLSIIDEQRAREAIIYINNNITKSLSLEEIADNIHISKSECCRCFKRATDMTPFEYIMSERIYESARKMQRQDPVCASVSELAESVGFNNASYYNKVFKKYFGNTPTKCMEILKKSHRDSLSPFGISLSRM